MASGGKKSDNGSSLWGILGGIAGGLALGGLAVYGASKLADVLEEKDKADQATSEERKKAESKAKKLEEDDDDDDDDYDLPRRDHMGASGGYNSYDSASRIIHHGDAASLGIGTYGQNPNIRARTSNDYQSSTFTSSQDMERRTGMETADTDCEDKPGNLSEQLNDYLESYVNIHPDELHDAIRIVEETKTELMRVFHSTNLPFGQFINTGSGFEDLQVVEPDNFDLLLPLVLDPSNWELVNCAESSFRTVGYYLVKRICWDTSQFGATEWDRYLEGTYLSPHKLSKHLHGVLQFGLDDVVNIKDCYANNHMLSIFVGHSKLRSKVIKINVIPLIKFEDASVVARAHPLVKSHNMEGLKNLWQQNFAHQEIDVVKCFDEGDGCQKECLRILKAMSMNDGSFLRHVDSYVLKSVLFHLSFQEDVWEKEALPERVIDMFMTLRDFLEQGRLPHYFKPSIDLFEDKTKMFKENLLAYIQMLCSADRIGSLLRKQ